MTAPLPEGFGLELEPSTRQLGQEWIFGGTPGRALRLSDTGRGAWQEITRGTPTSEAARRLARRLTDLNAAQPVPPRARVDVEATVVVPVYERVEELDRCLASLGTAYRVIVVDDASIHGAAIRAVCLRHGAQLVRRDRNGGPGQARNSGLALVTSPFVAFVDSDCEPPTDWIPRLATHFDDELVGAVAPRIVPLEASSESALSRYLATNGPLDLGDQAARVTSGSRVSYVPTAALLARTATLQAIATDGDVFDPALRVGEDVDLVWRMDAAEWRVRYDPGVEVAHHEPTTWTKMLNRRYRYGTSAAPLARRHPRRFRSLVLSRTSTVAAAGVLMGRPAIAVAATVTAVARMRKALQSKGIPSTGVIRAVVQAEIATILSTGRYLTQFASPLLVWAAVRRGRLARRLGASALLVLPSLRAWATSRGRLDAVRFASAYLADDVIYGLGVWVGCARERSVAAVRPARGYVVVREVRQ